MTVLQACDRPSWTGGRTERPQAILRSFLLARRVVAQVQERFFVCNLPTTPSAPLRVLRGISLVAAGPPGQEGKSHACKYGA